MTTPTAPKLIRLALVPALSLALTGLACAQDAAPPDGELSLEALQQQIAAQNQRIDDMRTTLQEQERDLAQLQRALDEQRLDATRARGATPPANLLLPPMAQVSQVPLSQPASREPTLQEELQSQVAMAQQDPVTRNLAQQAPQQPVGQAPASDARPPEIAQIFDQPGVLTPHGQFILEPSLQFGYSSNDRVALVGFTIIPALLIGLIDVRQVKTTTATATLTGRYGLSDRFELEAKLPYVYVNGDTVSREIFTGSAVDNVFNAHGSGLGDVEVTARYQLNRGGPDQAFYIGWLRYKSRTGKDLFEVVTDCVTRCVANTTGTGLPLELPTGTGFESIQPGLTWLYPSDPIVFFGSFSYLHNFKRKNVSRTVLGGVTEPLGEIEAGDILGFNVGLGLALNEKAAISLGYDQSIVDRTKQNGKDAAGSVRVVLGTLLLGGSYRFSDKVSLNVALGVGVTRDTPDVTLTARVPISF
ncbi:autotransporter outer membrane beta-barrel domain-containing protein [Lysobacter sp. Root667]|uniref:autotransporter outer membrane beta-barrel domain-containing protein n=1 Tax=Lysobacter sp. Root667 TaxID=1736581 RepID=UPI000A8A936A|nr:autotransporter outer membrane beta-barrel domain-containing protein [Lysobacter sp. Root667]